MLLQSSPSRLRTRFKIIIPFLLLVGRVFSQTPTPTPQQKLPPGIIGSLKEVALKTREVLTEEYQKLNSANQIESKPSAELIQRAKFDELFLKSIFLHSQQRYLDMMEYNSCHFYALLENRLFKSSLGQINYLLMKDGDRKFLIETKTYLKEIYKTKCQSLGQISQIFAPTIVKKTIDSLTFPVPKTNDDCKAIFSDWKKNDYLPYLCAIPDKIAKGKRAQKIKSQSSSNNLTRIRSLNEIIRLSEAYSKDIDFFKRSYLNNLCSGIESIDNFCKPYLTSNAWSRIVNGELDSFYLDYKCRNLLKKSSLNEITRNNLLACAKKLKDDPKTCVSRSADGFSSLYPRPNCSLIGKAINNSRLNVDYHDCPGQIDNGAVTNIYRIISHFFPTPQKSLPSTCKAEVNNTLKVLRDKSKNVSDWPLKICYDDKIENKEVCLDYIPGSLKEVSVSEDRVVTHILKRTNKIRPDQSCQVLNSGKYNPALLEYKNGCFIVFNEKNCSDTYCKRKIIINEKEIEGLEYRGRTQFDYFPNNWRDQNKSVVNLLEEVYKIRSKRLRNLTELEVFLRQFKKGIIHGAGCAEDIIPRYFKRKSFNQCTPLPFILDGVLEIDNNKVLITRTSYDDVHSPRLIPWNWIFTGVMKYQGHHPLNQWNLYGLTL